jgi:hypothetical protein
MVIRIAGPDGLIELHLPDVITAAIFISLLIILFGVVSGAGRIARVLIACTREELHKEAKIIEESYHRNEREIPAEVEVILSRMRLS